MQLQCYPAIYLDVTDVNGKKWDRYKAKFPDNCVWECDDKVKIHFTDSYGGKSGPEGRKYAA